MSVEVRRLTTRTYERQTQASYLGTYKTRATRRIPVPEYMDPRTTSDPEPVREVGPTAATLEALDRETRATGARLVACVAPGQYLVFR